MLEHAPNGNLANGSPITSEGVSIQLVRDVFQGTSLSTDIDRAHLIVGWFHRIGFRHPREALVNLRTILGNDPEERDRLLTDYSAGEFQIVKFLNSLHVTLKHGAQSPDKVLADLIKDRDISSLPSLNRQECLDRMREIALIPHDLTITRSLTVSEGGYMSWSNRPRLGTLFIATKDDKLVAKIRITEIENPQDEHEWNIGGVSYHPDRIKVTAANKYRYYPGEPFASGPTLFSSSRLENLARFGRENGVSRLDLRPQYYHLYHGCLTFGAVWDEQHPSKDEEQQHVRRIEAALDRLNLLGLRERSWALYEGKVTDMDSKEILKWLYPRVVYACREPCKTN